MESIRAIIEWLEAEEAAGATDVAVDEGGLQLVTTRGDDAEEQGAYEIGGLPRTDADET